MSPSRGSGLATACIMSLFSFFIFTMQEPLAPLLLAASNIGPASIGFILGISFLGSLFVPIPAGLLVRRYGYRVPLGSAAFLLAGSYLVLGFFPSVVTMVGCLFLIESGKAALILGQQLRIGDIATSEDTSASFGWYSASVFTGQMLGPVAAGFALDRVGAVPAWLLMAAIMSIIASGFFRARPTGRSPADAPAQRPSLTRECRDVFTPIAGAAIFASFAFVLAIGVRMAFYPLFLSGNFSGTAIGILIGMRSFGAVGGRFLLAPFIRLCGGRVRALLGVMVFLALGLAAVPLGSGFIPQAANSLVFGLAVGIGTPLTMSLTTDYVHRGLREISMSVRLTSNQLGLFAGPLALGPVAGAFGYGPVFVAAGVFVFACGLATALRLAANLRRL